MRFFARLLINALAIILTSYVFPSSVSLASFGDALIVAIILALLNTFLKPFMMLIAFPINMLTFGVFTIVINALIILIASSWAPGFQVHGFLTAVIFGILLSLLTSLLFVLFGMEE